MDVTLSTGLEVIQTQMQTPPQFHHPLLQQKGPTTLQDHDLRPYVLGLGFWGPQVRKNEPRSFKGEESRLILRLLFKEPSIATTSAYWYGQESPTCSSEEVLLPVLGQSSRTQTKTKSFFFKVSVLQSSTKQLMKAPSAAFPQP